MTLDSHQLGLFVRVVERGGFAAAAEGTGLTPSAISKAVTRLEDRLGVRLLQRSTRRLSLTTEGETLLARGRDILAALAAAAEEATAGRARPRGLVRVSVGTAYAKHGLAPRLARFREAYPDIRLDLVVTDRRVDVIGEGFDVAIRAGPIRDEGLSARRLTTTRRALCASPVYLARRGTPTRLEELALHEGVLLAQPGGAVLAWPFLNEGRRVEATPGSALICDSADLVRDLALTGLGIVRLATFLVQGALDDGRLVEILAGSHLGEEIDITALSPPGRAKLPRVRAFLDFLTQEA
jgi:DNA-binding transcriptional LysR family regulator